MAIKDWNNIKKNFWRNEKDRATLYSSIKLRKITAPNSFLGSNASNWWVVSLYNYEGTVENYSKYFKTEVEARKYIKQYMRNN